MPSGAKKRKAAKKKKEIEANINNNNPSTSISTSQSLGDNDLKTHDEKGSDGSPLSQGHDSHERSFSGEKEREVGNGAGIGEGKMIQKYPDDKNVNVEFGKSGKKSHDGGSSEEGGSSSSSSSSSSDDEGHVVEKNVVVVEPVEPKDSLPGEVVHVTKGAPVDKVESVLNKNGVENSGISSSVMESGRSDAASSDAMGLAAQESEDKLLLSYNSPRSDTTYGAEDVKDSGNTDLSQPLLASAPPTEQRTSWTSCCGIFEVLTGSNR